MTNFYKIYALTSSIKFLQKLNLSCYEFHRIDFSLNWIYLKKSSSKKLQHIEYTIPARVGYFFTQKKRVFTPSVSTHFRTTCRLIRPVLYCSYTSNKNLQHLSATLSSRLIRQVFSALNMNFTFYYSSKQNNLLTMNSLF